MEEKLTKCLREEKVAKARITGEVKAFLSETTNMLGDGDMRVELTVPRKAISRLWATPTWLGSMVK